MMKLIASALVLCASILAVDAQNNSQSLQALEAMPICGAICMQKWIQQSSCPITDQQCLCTNTALGADISECVKTNCTYRDALTTTNSISQICDWPVRDKRPVIRGVTISFFVVATFFYLARMTARMPFFGSELGPDDYAISIAYLFTIACTTVQLLLTSYGVGLDIWTVPHSYSDDLLTAGLKVAMVYEEAYLLATWITKISILLLYRRIFQDSKLRAWVNFSIAFCAITLFCLFWPNIFHCWPISYAWTFWDGEHTGSCASGIAPFWASAGLNIFGDLLVIFLPLPTIWKMSLSKGKRAGIIIMFSAGIIITIVSTARLSTIHMFHNSVNQTYDYVNPILYTIVEVDITIICACLPGTRNFYERVVRGRIVGKGRFATNSSRPDSAASLQRETSMRSNSAHSDISKTSTLVPLKLAEKVILVVNDINVEERAVNPALPALPAKSWSNCTYVEEWPTRTR